MTEHGGPTLAQLRKLALIGAVITAVVMAVGLAGLDVPLLWAIRELPPEVSKPIQALTHLGSSGVYILVLVPVLAYSVLVLQRERPATIAGVTLAGIAISGICSHIGKLSLGRYRPAALLDHGHYGFTFFGLSYDTQSFPSGHATTAGTMLAALCLYAPGFRWLWIPLFLTVGISRLFTGSHYLSDVAAGLFLGIFVTLFCHAWWHEVGRPKLLQARAVNMQAVRLSRHEREA